MPQQLHAHAAAAPVSSGAQHPDGNSCARTQADRLFEALRQRGMTTMEMLQLGISCSPWRRVAEGAYRLQPGERLDKSLNADGRVVYAVVRDRV